MSAASASCKLLQVVWMLLNAYNTPAFAMTTLLFANSSVSDSSLRTKDKI